MSLIVEITEKIRQLLDKPISPATKKQIIQLTNKQIVPSSDLLYLFNNKYRGDLLIQLIKNQPVPLEKLEYLLTSLITQLLEYKFQEAEALWMEVLGKEEMRGARDQWTSKLLKQCLRISNQGLRASQLQLLISNSHFLWSVKEGKLFQKFSSYYISAFLKHNIYLPGYAGLLGIILSKLEADSTSIVTQLIQKQLVQRLLELLRVNSDKLLFVFQNECLRACQKLLLYKNTPIKDTIIFYNCQKILELYLWKKPTRECAFSCKEALEIAKKSYEQENAQKMIRNYTPMPQRKQQPLLIENIIEKTNQYQRNQQLLISDLSHNHRPGSSFLQKGVGNGGGKSIMLSPSRTIHRQAKGLQQLVQSCLSKPAQSVYPLPLDAFSEERAEDSMLASTISIEQDQNFAQISNLIDLAFQYKFEESPF